MPWQQNTSPSTSVGGWPAAGGWLTTAAALARMNTARLVVAAADPVGLAGSSAKTRADDVRRLLGVDRFSTRTANAIAQVADQPAAAVAIGAVSPEYTVSA